MIGKTSLGVATLPDKNTSVCLHPQSTKGVSPDEPPMSFVGVCSSPDVSQETFCLSAECNSQQVSFIPAMSVSSLVCTPILSSQQSSSRCGHSHGSAFPVGSCPEFKEGIVEIVSAVFKSGLPNRDGLRVPLSNHGLHADEWDIALAGYFDKDEIVTSIRYGWDLGLQENPCPKDAHFNHPSAREFEADVQKYIDTELVHGALCGPFDESNLPFKVAASPLATVPKANSETRRTVTDCSYGGLGVNAWISRHTYRGKEFSVKLPGIDSLVDMVKKCRISYPGAEILVFKLDLSRYYRNWRICPGNVPFTSIRWLGKVYLDLAYSFGNRAAMFGSQRSSDGLAWSVRTQMAPAPNQINSGRDCKCPAKCTCGDNLVEAYVDDFFGAVPKFLAEFLWNSFLALLARLGLQASETKGHLCPPARQMVCLGFFIDLDTNTISIPPDKLENSLLLLQDWTQRKQATVKMLQKLLGVLLHLCRVVQPGRLFLGRMLATLRRAHRLDRMVNLDRNFQLDVEWWVKNIRPWNGVSFLEFTDFNNKITLDASSNGYWNNRPGIGGFNYIRSEFFRCTIPDSLMWMDIADLELLAHLLAARLWGYSWRGLRIHGKTDSTPCEFLLRNGKSRIDHRLQMARLFTELQFKSQFLWIPDGIRSKANVYADCLSRWASKERRDTFYTLLAREG